MSTLKVNTIQNTAGTDLLAPLQSGSAKAWINFNGTTVTSSTDMTVVRDSYNVSSLVDSGTGHYTVNFSTAFSNTNYCYTDGGNLDSNGARTVKSVTQNTNSFTFRTVGLNVSLLTSVIFFDPTTVCLAFFGD